MATVRGVFSVSTKTMNVKTVWTSLCPSAAPKRGLSLTWKMSSMPLSFPPAAAGRGHLCDSDGLERRWSEIIALFDIYCISWCVPKILKHLADPADAQNKWQPLGFPWVALSFWPALSRHESNNLCGESGAHSADMPLLFSLLLHMQKYINSECKLKPNITNLASLWPWNKKLPG